MKLLRIMDALDGSGTVDIGHTEKENAKQFTLGQNFPNPYTEATTIPFHLRYPSSVKLAFFDLSGKKVAEEPSFVEKAMKNPMVKQVGTTIVRELTRGLLGALGFGGKKKIW